MTEADIERLAEAVHNAWCEEEKRQEGANADPDLLSYAELPEATKKYDRAMVRAVLDLLEAPADLVWWVREDQEKARQLMQAERIVEYGSIELTYRDGKFMHLDAMPRMRTSKKEVDSTR